MHKIRLKIPEGVREDILKTVKKFNDNGYQCYLVGGSVRDLVMGFETYDYDFATNARPSEVMRLFKRVIPTGIKHGTVSVLSGKRRFEITTYRADGEYIDGRRPEQVFFSSNIEEDVKRRDFTINGLAYDVIKEEILDYVGGIDDLRAGIIRTIGDPLDRFSEDGLRSYRACRFAAKLNFEIEKRTFNAIPDTLEIVKKVSVERIRDEIKKLMESERPSIGLEYMRKCGLLELALPELNDCYGVEQNKFHLYDVYYHSIYSCDAAPRDRLTIRLAALFHDLGKVPTRRLPKSGDYTFYNHEVVGAKMTRRLMRRLRFSNEEINSVNNLILNHMFHYTENWTDGAVRRFMRKVGCENINDLIELRRADREGNGAREGLPSAIRRLMGRVEAAIEAENAITVRDLKINGHDLMKLFSLNPGPVIGKILNTLLEDVLDNPELNEHETLIKRASEILEQEKDITKPKKKAPKNKTQNTD